MRTHTILDYKRYAVPGAFSSHMGSAQEIGSDTFVIGWGGRATCNALFSEIDFSTGKILFEVLSPNTSGSFPDVYKVYKFEQ